MRTIKLDRHIGIGSRSVAAIVELALSCRGGRSGVYLYGAKRPLAILIHDGDEMLALDPYGEPLSPDEVESLCPGALEAFLRG